MGTTSLVDRANYRPYGEQLGFGSVSESKGFIGERQDDETGLMYLHARYYDPRLGRFIQPDPLAPYLPGVGTNRYAYAFNNPVMFSDPSGLGEGYDHDPKNPDGNHYGGGGGGSGFGGGGNGGGNLSDVGAIQIADTTIGIGLCETICAHPWDFDPSTSVDPVRAQAVIDHCACTLSHTGPTLGPGGGGDGGGGSHGGGSSGTGGGLFGGGTLSAFHTALDLASFVPGLATVTSLANAAIYAAEGNYADAALSALGAIPLGGQLITAGRVGTKIARNIRTIDFLKEVAVRAERKIGGVGAVAGIHKHTYAAKLIKRYQRRYGDVGGGLSTEQSYLGGAYLGPSVNVRGSVRLDVVEGPLKSPMAIFDFKFTINPNPTLSATRVRSIRANAGLNPSVPITVIHP